MAQEFFGVLTVCDLKANLEEEKFGDKVHNIRNLQF